MDEKLIELENELIIKYPARLQKITIDKKQFYEDEYKGEVTFCIKTLRNVVTFKAKMLDSKTYDIQCNVSKKQTKKIKDIIKMIDYVIENS